MIALLVHDQASYEPYYKRYNEYLPVTNLLSDNSLTLPLFVGMKESDIGFIVNEIYAAESNAIAILESSPVLR